MSYDRARHTAYMRHRRAVARAIRDGAEVPVREDGRRSTTTPGERFWSHVDQSGECWVWTAARSHKGYGTFGVRHGRMTPAHRFSWELSNGPIPDGLFVLHSCDNPPCVRPEHLFLGSKADNNRDAAIKGRMHERLTADQVVEIRRRAANGEGYSALGREYGVSNVAVRRYVLGTLRPHVPFPEVARCG